MEIPAGAHVLIVDDDPVARLLAGRMLQRAGWRVTLAEAAEEAIRRAELESFDAVLMDAHLPDASGLDATRRLRDLDIRIPIVGVTGDNAIASGSEWREAGMDACLRKPFRIAEFLDALENESP